MKKAKEVKMPVNATVWVYDDEQPISNPKPHWLQIAAFNENSCSYMYAEAYRQRHKNAHLKIKTFRDTAEINLPSVNSVRNFNRRLNREMKNKK